MHGWSRGAARSRAQARSCDDTSDCRNLPSAEHDDLPNRFAFLQAVEARVDVEPQAVGEQPVDRKTILAGGRFIDNRSVDRLRPNNCSNRATPTLEQLRVETSMANDDRLIPELRAAARAAFPGKWDWWHLHDMHDQAHDYPLVPLETASDALILSTANWFEHAEHDFAFAHWLRVFVQWRQCRHFGI
jgi:hypothetical protein